ncbi:MAG: adenosylcobinamide-GDP ribazoletransferase [Gammaproteobacteria bacterium]|nr:adenosylcobinamide-GDP ribazoletransferase [Gammaproteobacteria bacterium]
MLSSLWLALQFLTRIPVPAQSYPTPQDWGRSVLAYPLVGLLIGVVLVLLHWLLANADPGVQAGLLLLVWALITGGVHLEGLANSADAWAGGHGDRQRTLDILKDPRSGPAAMMVVVLAMILKFAALSVLVAESALEIILLAPVLGRSAIAALLLTTPYAQMDEVGAERAANVPKQAVGWTLAAVAAGALFLVGWGGLVLLFLLFIGGYMLRRMMIHRIGGLSKDTAGAICELTEVGVLTVVVLVWG